MGSLRTDTVPDLVRKALPKNAGEILLQVVVSQASQADAVAAAVARAFPMYNSKTDAKSTTVGHCHVEIISQDGQKVDVKHLQRLSDAVRNCARLVDTPASELSTKAYVAEATKVFDGLKKAGKPVELKIIQGEELRDGGFGGLWGVGKAAPFPPALVVMQYQPANATGKASVALVGKGICYDTGGLSMKSPTSMPGMKTDMGGSAAILQSFKVLVESDFAAPLSCLLCIAENSVDSLSTRPDDILHMYSGKTVEVNNTDAEGRLVLADGVAYASRNLNVMPSHIIDMATLTGAQMVCTGMQHAALVCNDAELEQVAVQAGRESGDLTFPILYCPELLKSEFKSEVADMKNSVKSRMNA